MRRIINRQTKARTKTKASEQQMLEKYNKKTNKEIRSEFIRGEEKPR